MEPPVKKIKKPKKVKKLLEELNPLEYMNLSETDHAKYIHTALDEMWILHTHSPNEAWQAGTINIIIMMANKKKMWVSPWYPDFSIYIPFKEWLVQCMIELKKAKGAKWGDNGSHLTNLQAAWLNHLQKVPLNFVYNAFGSLDALSIVKDLKHRISDLNTEEVLQLWKTKKYTDYVPLITKVIEPKSTKPRISRASKVKAPVALLQ